MAADITLPYTQQYRPSYEKNSRISTDSGRGSETSEKDKKKSLSHIVIDIPGEHLRKLKETEEFSSIGRETQHFSENTTMHGPKRIYQGKKCSLFFWVLMVIASIGFLIYQTYALVSMYVSRPTVSQVSFLISDDGLDFPMITLCNFNAIKNSALKKQFNSTGDFSEDLLDYILETNLDAPALWSNANSSVLKKGDLDYNNYMSKYPDFTITDFFMKAGFECEDVFKICSFGGQNFDCCKYAKPVLTNMGKCFSLYTQSGPAWMQKQAAAGVNAGLQVTLDTHLEEQYSGVEDAENAIYSFALEKGYRYFVHDANRIPYLSSEGISISPSNRVYSALSTNRYVLLPLEDWGNCSNAWPHEFGAAKLPYTAASCESYCMAKYFNDTCGCSPSNYNIDNSFQICTPLQTINCMDDRMKHNVNNGSFYFSEPNCNSCKIECDSVVYHAYNSYGSEFSDGSLKWLNNRNPNWDNTHMKQNFLTINVFFRDLTHTEYSQVRGTSITELLSNIGGNMGMFLGMSLITIAEILLYCCKISWLAISKKRRHYMYQKKQREKTHEEEIEETVRGFRLFNSPRDENNSSMKEIRARVQTLVRGMQANSIIENEKTGIENLAYQPQVDGKY